MKRREPTIKQAQIIETISKFKNDNDCYPTYREIAKIMDISLGSVQMHIRLLEKKNKIFRIPHIARNIRIDN